MADLNEIMDTLSSLTVIEAAPPWRVELLDATAHLQRGTEGPERGGKV